MMIVMAVVFALKQMGIHVPYHLLMDLLLIVMGRRGGFRRRGGFHYRPHGGGFGFGNRMGMGMGGMGLGGMNMGGFRFGNQGFRQGRHGGYWR